MNEDNIKKERFVYSYSAAQQEEVQRIRSRYMPAEEDKMETLRRLDASVTQKGTAVSLALGVVSALVLGVGMCFVLVWEQLLLGIAIGVAGIVMLLMLIPMFVGLK